MVFKYRLAMSKIRTNVMIFRTSGHTTQNQYCPDKISTVGKSGCVGCECSGAAGVGSRPDIVEY